jgi:hypothetical protein
MFCTTCGVANAGTGKFCSSCGAAVAVPAGMRAQAAPAITPAQAQADRKTAALPPGVAGFSWGAFLLNWIWAIGNHVWIGLLALIPYVNFVVAIWLGFKGREMAWRAKPWASVEEFDRVQKLWSKWAVGIVLAAMVLGVLAAMVVAGADSD